MVNLPDLVAEIWAFPNRREHRVLRVSLRLTFCVAITE